MIHIDLSDVLAAATSLGNAPEAIRAELDSGLTRAAEEVARAEKQQAPKAFSLLTNSIRATMDADLSRLIAPGVAHAEYVVAGRKPGPMPDTRPDSDFFAWVKLVTRKHGRPLRQSAFLLGRAVAARGIAANPFPERTAAAMTPRVEALLQAAVARGLQRVMGNE